MKSPVCSNCHAALRARLLVRIQHLQTFRRAYQKPSVSLYSDLLPPIPEQLASATSFFTTYRPRKVWTATEWRTNATQENTVLTPEVAFLGRSNVGKSSLLNALLRSPTLNHVGPRPGKTTTMHAYSLARVDPRTGGALKGAGGDMDAKLTVLDMPGYGHASHDDWGKEILKYITRRKQLRRVFVLLDARHGMKETDRQMLHLLRQEQIPHQIIASKCDCFSLSQVEQLNNAILNLKGTVSLASRKSQFKALGDILAIGALGDGRKNDRLKLDDMQGVEEVQWAVLQATGLEEYAMNLLYPRRTKTTPNHASASSTQNNSTSTTPPTHSTILPPPTNSKPRPSPSLPTVGRGMEELFQMISLNQPPPPTTTTTTTNKSSRSHNDSISQKRERVEPQRRQGKAPPPPPPPPTQNKSSSTPFSPHVAGMAELEALSASAGGKQGGGGRARRSGKGSKKRNMPAQHTV